MKIAVIADDLTGAADTGVQLSRAGYRVAVVFRGESPPEDFDVVVWDTDSRTRSAGAATKRVHQAGNEARRADIVYKKLDSTLRGSVAVEISAALEATGRSRAVVAPAFPAAGRTTANGVQRVHGIPVHETEMQNDPHTPVTEGHVPGILYESFSSVGSISIGDLDDAEGIRRTLEESVCVVADAERDADLEALVRAVPDPSEVLWVGSAGLASALGVVYPGPKLGEPHVPLKAVGRVLVVIGSMSGVARGQLRRLTEEYGEVATPVPTGRSGVKREVVEMVQRTLQGGSCAVLHSPEERRERSSSGSFVGALAEVVEHLAEEEAFDALVLTGGSTAMGVARRIGASGIRLDGEVEPGVPIGTMIGSSPYRVVTKAGAFGTEGTLVAAVKTLLQSGEE